jgi:RNA 3'-terminal phosphate cyclase-like protein
MALKFSGCGNFRQRLVCATLSGKAIRISDIRVDDEKPGLRDFEASFLRLLEKLTNGCVVEINETGTPAAGCLHPCFDGFLSYQSCTLNCV